MGELGLLLRYQEAEGGRERSLKNILECRGETGGAAGAISLCPIVSLQRSKALQYGCPAPFEAREGWRESVKGSLNGCSWIIRSRLQGKN